ncbi:MAG: hypothetical protein ABH882_04330 [Candidatus Omnitrophota bacterium]|nr:hypothetical protein [Candidatus Omnitrophota bacterium]MBU1928323.1 hypothetical protein [Candidatus Omnitrophota bacterium]MBU2034361.1 hypothetical protein [Candidatus Omnitrophota bacterium]MBU2258834.1 hypothetical protein [Candidatus Omnitrophota bacterium]
MKRLAICLFTLVFLSGIGLVYAQTKKKDKDAQKVVGGPCQYQAFKGKCRVTSIDITDFSRKQANISAGPGYEGYEIRFRFIPLQPLEGDNIQWAKADIANKRYLLLLGNSWYPGLGYIKKYGLGIERSFNCDLKILTKGTCTPMGFIFNDINATDYFESRK